jgi:hypothetical protein
LLQAVVKPRAKVPLLPPPVSPLPLAVVTPVIVPAPGKLCPGAKVSWPLLAIFNPVSAGVEDPEPNNKFKLPEGVLVLLPKGSACQRKFSLTAALLLLLKAEAVQFNACEFDPAAAVAVLIEGNASRPRIMLEPLTSSAAAGVFVLTPTLALAPVPD